MDPQDYKRFSLSVSPLSLLSVDFRYGPGHEHDRSTLNVLFALLMVVAIAPVVSAQNARPAAPGTRVAGAATMAANLPPNYVIGPDDVLGIVFFGDEALTGDVVVRPDGKISVPLLHDIQAAGLSPGASDCDEGGSALSRSPKRRRRAPDHSSKVLITARGAFGPTS